MFIVGVSFIGGKNYIVTITVETVVSNALFIHRVLKSLTNTRSSLLLSLQHEFWFLSLLAFIQYYGTKQVMNSKSY